MKAWHQYKRANAAIIVAASIAAFLGHWVFFVVEEGNPWSGLAFMSSLLFFVSIYRSASRDHAESLSRTEQYFVGLYSAFIIILSVFLIIGES